MTTAASGTVNFICLICGCTERTVHKLKVVQQDEYTEDASIISGHHSQQWNCS